MIRRTAGEVLKSLEARVARLERKTASFDDSKLYLRFAKIIEAAKNRDPNFVHADPYSRGFGDHVEGKTVTSNFKSSGVVINGKWSERVGKFTEHGMLVSDAFKKVFFVYDVKTIKPYGEWILQAEEEELPPPAPISVSSVVDSLEDFVRRNTRSIQAWAEENDYGDYDGMAGIKMVEKDIKRKISEGWDIRDLVRYYLLAEEIDPRVDEDVALLEMAKLVAKNKR